MSNYSGYVLANQKAGTLTTNKIELTEPEAPGGPMLIYQEHAYGIRRWDEYKLYSPVALGEEPDSDRDIYEYQIYIVRGYAKLIVLAARRPIVDFALSQVLNRKVFPNFRKVNVFVDRLIEFCTKPESEFLITSLHGRFSGPNRDLKSMSLYGDDVTNSPLYADNHLLFNFHSCGVGRRLFDGLRRLKSNQEGEIVRISHDGYVNLNLRTRRGAQELIRVINFVIEKRWVEDWVLDAQGDNN